VSPARRKSRQRLESDEAAKRAPVAGRALVLQVPSAPSEAPDGPGERKERVLHTRVPGSLDRQIKHRARNLGLSVSTVVRHVLLNTFGLVEDIVTDSTNLALSITGDGAAPGSDGHAGRRGGAGSAANRGTSSDGDGEIVGWQEAVLNLNGVCHRCNAILHKGTRAAIGVRESPGPLSLLCRPCLEKLEP